MEGMMIRDHDDDALRTPGLPAPEAPPLSRKRYEPPVLVDWGSIVDLTHGFAADIQDDGFSGSGGV